MSLYMQHETPPRWNKGAAKLRDRRGHRSSCSHAAMAGAAIALGMQLQVGDLVTIGTGDAARCARVTYIDTNPTGVSWYWLEFEQATVPRSVVRVRLEQLQSGCAAVAAGSTRSLPE